MVSGLPMKSSMRKLPRNFKSWFSGWGLNSLPSSFLSSLSTKITQWTSWLEEIHIASFWINTLIRIWRWPRQPWIGKSFYVLACNCSCIIPNCGRQRTPCVLGNLLAELQRLPLMAGGRIPTTASNAGFNDWWKLWLLYHLMQPWIPRNPS